MPEQKEWYSQREIADKLGIPVRKLYGKVNALRTAGAIRWIEDPTDQRAILIHEDSIDLIAKAVQEGRAAMPPTRPSAPFDIKRGDSRLISVDDAAKRYDLDPEWIRNNLTRFKFPGVSNTSYVYIPELEYVIDQVEIIPPGQD